MESQATQDIPDKVLDVLKTSQVGYLSVSSSKGEIFSYPVIFYYAGHKIYFITPISAAKLKFIRANPTVSFLVDNGQFTTNTCGSMFQGKAKVFSIAKTVVSLLSVGPKMAGLLNKYKGYFSFYASGKELPDERKLYKYRLIRIDPSKIIYWVGYKFGRYFPKNSANDPLSEATEETKLETFGRLLESADEELAPPGEELPQSPAWNESLEAATKDGTISEEERNVISSYRGFLRQAAADSKIGPEVTREEKKLLGKWKKDKPTENS